MNDSLFVKCDSVYVRIEISEIKWIYAKGHYSTFYLENNIEYQSRISLNKILDFIDSSTLIQVHRNYLVNIEKVSSYDPIGSITIDTQVIPVSKKYKKDIENNFPFLN